MERHRIAELDSDEVSACGSGYLIADGLVLTSGHVVPGERCRARVCGAADWRPSTVVWNGTEAGLDAALVRIDGAATGRLAVRAARVVGTEPVPVHAVGFPLAERSDDGRWDTAQMDGNVLPLGRAIDRSLAVDVKGAVPVDGTLWSGMSGAPLFSGTLLIGVLARQPGAYDGERIVAVAATRLWEHPAFAAAVEGHCGERPGAVELVGAGVAVLEPPYRRGNGAAAGALLSGRSETVPFHGRAGELGELDGWCDAREPVLVRLVVGGCGRGKTRFAAEACARRALRGWVSGFLSGDATGDRLQQLAHLDEPLLVVVDEAASRGGVVVELVETLVRAGRAKPARVVAVAREAGAWWEELASLGERDGEAASLLALSSNAIVDLPVLAPTPEERRATFDAAWKAFVDVRGDDGSATPAVALDDPLFGDPLFLNMAAMSAGGELAAGDGASLRAELVRVVLAKERQLWKQTATGAGLDGSDSALLRRAVAVATMTVVDSEAEAVEALRAVPDLADGDSAARRHKVARWLSGLYPQALPVADAAGGGGARKAWLGPMVPDVLAEAHLAQVLEEVPDLADRLLERSQPGQVLRVLTVLNLAAREQPVVRDALRASVVARMEELWRVGVEVGIRTGDPIGRLLADALEQQPGVVDPDEVAAALPSRTVALVELGYVAAQQCRDVARGRLASVSDASESERRELRRQLAERELAVTLRARQLGLDRPALEAVERAVELLRALDAERAGEVDALYAKALNMLAVRLGAMEHHQRALEAARAALVIRERLAAADRRHLPDLAESVSTYAARLTATRRGRHAVAEASRAVDLRRELCEHDRAQHEPDLARSLTVLSNRLSDVRRFEEALAAATEAVEIRRELARNASDSFEPDLASSLSARSMRLAAVGQHEEALRAVEEAVSMRRRLTRARPRAYEIPLSRSLNSLSNRLAKVGRPEEALAASQEALEIRRRRDELEPGTVEEELSASLSQVGKRLHELGRDEDALPLLDASVAKRRRLIADRPDYFPPLLARSLRRRADVLDALGRPAEAAASRAEADALTASAS